jgi:hypothetical protein
MGSAWLSLVGVVVGVAGTLLVTWINSRAATEQARQARQDKRLDDVRERAVEGSLGAVEAVASHDEGRQTVHRGSQDPA